MTRESAVETRFRVLACICGLLELARRRRLLSPAPRVPVVAHCGSGGGAPTVLPVETITLWRPVGQAELDLIERSGWRRFPPRLAGQPIFYPVLNEAYATKIARDWNTKDPASGFVGYVLRFETDATFAAQFPVHRVGGAGIDELWVPAERLDDFNAHIVGTITVTAAHSPEAKPEPTSAHSVD